jgi:hypothetical protein
MLADLHAIMDTREFEENGLLKLTKTTLDGEGLVLSFEVTTGEDDASVQHWNIVCDDMRAHRLSLRAYCDIELVTDHVLLWPHSMAVTSVSFYGHVNDPFPIIGALYQQHMQLVGTWIPFGQYFNPAVSLDTLLCGTAGMLAQGPEALVLAYENVLQRCGLQTSHLESKAAKHWDEEHREWVEEHGPLAVLLLEDSFVVAATFDVQRSDG